MKIEALLRFKSKTMPIKQTYMKGKLQSILWIGQTQYKVIIKQSIANHMKWFDDPIHPEGT